MTDATDCPHVIASGVTVETASGVEMWWRCDDCGAVFRDPVDAGEPEDTP